MGKFLAMMAYIRALKIQDHQWQTGSYQEEANIPKWMIKEKTMLTQKDSQKGTIPSNYNMCTYDIENSNRTD